MGEQQKSKYLTGFTQADAELLVQIVKLAQHRKIVGEHGDWKEFLRRVVDKGKPNGDDPARRDWKVLQRFVRSFFQEEDIQVVKRIRKWRDRNHVRRKVNWAASPEQKLVELTQEHPRYLKSFCFPSYSEDWIYIKEGSPSDASVPERLISLDCEMGVGVDNRQHLLKMCVVDRDCNVLLDTLVKPDVAIKDYLTSITGLTAAAVEECTFSRVDAQRRLQELLQPGVILVGHSVNHDLEVLRVEYRRIIDTSLIFNSSNHRRIGLNDLCKAVLGYSFREKGKAHDCLLDAIVPMRLVLHALKHGLSKLDLPQESVVDIMAPSLLLHKLPAAATPSILRRLFPRDIPCAVEMIEGKTKSRKALAKFESPEHADQVFEQLVGELGEDSSGLPQKTVDLWGKGLFKHAAILIRKGRVQKVEAAQDVGMAPSQATTTEARQDSATEILRRVTSGATPALGAESRKRPLQAVTQDADGGEKDEAALDVGIAPSQTTGSEAQQNSAAGTVSPVPNGTMPAHGSENRKRPLHAVARDTDGGQAGFRKVSRRRKKRKVIKDKSRAFI